MTTKPNVNLVWASEGTKFKPVDAKITQGWVKEIPPHEWFNWEMNRQGSFSSYVNSIGIPEWDATTQYFASRSLTNFGGVIYKAVQNSLNKSPDTETEFWVLLGFSPWKVVADNYNAQPGDKIILNNRTEIQTVNLPTGVNYGDEITIHPYPFTKYTKFRLNVVGGSNLIMGLDEDMSVTEDNVVFNCKFLGKLWGWVVERVGTAGNSNTRTTYLGASYGSGASRIYDANIVEGAPLVMMVHGGGWTSGSKNNSNFDSGNYVLYFPEKYGLSFAAINYTLATPSVPSFPTAVNDVILAAEHFKSTLNVQRIHLVGSSAGANIAALAAIARPDLFESFVGYYGVYDLTNLAQIDPSLYSSIEDYTDNAAAASPLLTANSFTIPAYLVHDSADDLIDVQQTLDFATALGVTPDIVTGQSPTHGFKIFGEFNSTLPDYAKRVFKFLDAVGE